MLDLTLEPIASLGMQFGVRGGYQHSTEVASFGGNLLIKFYGHGSFDKRHGGPFTVRLTALSEACHDCKLVDVEFRHIIHVDQSERVCGSIRLGDLPFQLPTLVAPWWVAGSGPVHT